MYEREIPKKAVELIKHFEGFRPLAYKCPAGVWTVGYGSTTINGITVQMGDRLTEAQAVTQIVQYLERLQYQILKIITVPINDNQLAALDSFVYNIGVYAFQKSTLARFINARRFDDAANEFDKWVYAKSKRLPGLVTRRSVEKKLFLTK